MKIRMNMLPYRDAKRKEARQKFWAGFGVIVGVAVLLVVVVHIVIAGFISVQDETNIFIKSQNVAIDDRIKEIISLRENIEAVKSQQEIIGKLQSDRAAPTHLLDQMVRLVPNGMYLTLLKQKDSEVTVNGTAYSSDKVSSFMVSIQDSVFLAKPELIEIKSSIGKDGRRIHQFSLKFIVKSAKDDKGEEKLTTSKPAVVKASTAGSSAAAATPAVTASAPIPPVAPPVAMPVAASVAASAAVAGSLKSLPGLDSLSLENASRKLQPQPKKEAPLVQMETKNLPSSAPAVLPAAGTAATLDKPILKSPETKIKSGLVKAESLISK